MITMDDQVFTIPTSGSVQSVDSSKVMAECKPLYEGGSNNRTLAARDSWVTVAKKAPKVPNPTIM